MPRPSFANHRLAAIDIGSNSCLLVVARWSEGRLQLLSHRKEAIRLGSEIDAQGALSAAAMQRGWDCLERYALVLGNLPRERLRVVATQTLREASNRNEFLVRAQEILNCPVDVIDGLEEARLIYRGVAPLLPASTQRRLVVDIGGRSTELCLGRRLQALAVQSFAVGSTTWAQRHFASGELTSATLDLAEAAALEIISPHAATFGPSQWKHAYGSSGSAGAIAKVLSHASGEPTGWITREGLDWIRDELLQAGHIDRVSLGGLKHEQRPLIGGGFSLMRALFISLGISRMRVTHGALRHGVLHELADRLGMAG
ncbi:Ppx/GppA family phosphatase [Comamonas composti]|uniref:Ppx/GppA family phosphatase n=1 Tax=Comamonas composti TaxID=408558 RepID=UPI00047E9B2C|nr:Ppx/GppA family phosphatase [Comamonas composti]